jgi:hypothetical protein
MVVQENPGRSDSPLFMWLGHYGTYIMFACLAVMAAADLAGNPAFLTWSVAFAIAVWAAAFFTDHAYHQERLCERCIAATPLDPAAAVARWDVALRWRHARRAGIVVLVLVIAWFTAGSFLVPYRSGWTRALDVLALLVLGASYAADYLHRRFYPWCPYCRWDEGGDEEAVPVLPEEPAVR